jgi:predicted transport protein
MPKTPEEMYEAIARNLPDRTGKGLDEWLKVARDAPEGKRTQRIEWLMGHGLGRGQAQTVLYYARGMDIDYRDQSGLVGDMFEGRHEDLLPVFEEARALVSKMGDDIEVSARKTYVSFNRGRQFLIMLPRKGELVVGFALPEDHEDDRLQRAKNLGSDRINWYVGIKDAGGMKAHMDLVEAAYEAN